VGLVPNFVGSTRDVTFLRITLLSNIRSFRSVEYQLRAMCAAVSRCIAIACVAALVACQERLDSQESTASMHGTLTLAQRHSGYAGNREDWSGFLACWYQAAVVRHQEERRRDSNTPYIPVLARYARGAHMQRPVEGMPQAIQRLETSLGGSLPRS